MAKRKGKSVSFDAMVKFFMMQYDIPTKRDVEQLMKKLDHLESLIKSPSRGGRVRKKAVAGGRPVKSATDTVLETIAGSKTGIGFSEIKAATSLEEKQIRNILFRLNKLGKIKRVTRGTYKSA